MAFQFIPHDTKINFFKFKWYAFAFSILLALASVYSLATKGLNFGIDFRGGILMEVRATKTETGAHVDMGPIRQTLSQLELGEVALQEFGTQKDILIRIQQQDGGEAAQQRAVVKVKEALGSGDYEYRRVEFVGPKVGGELINAGIWAVALSLLGIMVYIWFRFEWPFAVNALIATSHDVLVTLGLFSILQMDFNLTSVAAILTLAGYSLNDTVVVFDRIRENMRKYKKMPLQELLNSSINTTLSRTIMTSSTTFLAVMAILFFSGPVVEGFAIAMAWGILVGTYSSIYVASPLLIYFIRDKDRGRFFSNEPRDDDNGYSRAA